MPGLAEVVRDLAGLLIGEPAYAVRRHRATLAATLSSPYAASALLIALDDLRGRQAGVPVHRLYGGAARRVDTYAASPGYVEGQDPERTWPAEVAAYRAEGFGAVKLRIGRHPIAREAPILAAARAAAGDGVRLMADGNGGYGMADAVRMGDVLADLGFDWFEEPLPQRGGYPRYPDLAPRLRVTLAGGEIVETAAEARRLLDAGGVDVVQPEPVICGGIGALLEIADLAAGRGIPVVPHTSGGALGLVAALHAIACLPAHDLLRLELGRGVNPLRSDLLAAGPDWRPARSTCRTAPASASRWTRTSCAAPPTRASPWEDRREGRGRGRGARRRRLAVGHVAGGGRRAPALRVPRRVRPHQPRRAGRGGVLRRRRTHLGRRKHLGRRRAAVGRDRRADPGDRRADGRLRRRHRRAGGVVDADDSARRRRPRAGGERDRRRRRADAARLGGRLGDPGAAGRAARRRRVGDPLRAAARAGRRPLVRADGAPRQGVRAGMVARLPRVRRGLRRRRAHVAPVHPDDERPRRAGSPTTTSTSPPSRTAGSSRWPGRTTSSTTSRCRPGSAGPRTAARPGRRRGRPRSSAGPWRR